MDHFYFRIKRLAAVIAVLLLYPGSSFASNETEALRQELTELRQQMQRLQQTYEQQINALEQRLDGLESKTDTKDFAAPVMQAVALTAARNSGIQIGMSGLCAAGGSRVQ